MRPQQLVQKLDQVLSRMTYQYQDRARLRQDCLELFQSVHTLEPEYKSFSAGGNTVQLFYLYGVVPINYQGQVYNIPVTIYFDPPYPNKPPRCFVTPAENMAIREGHQNVDKNGMVFLPYLTDWRATGGFRVSKSTLPALVSSLRECFTAAPPVYAQPQNATPQQPPSAGQVLGGLAFEAVRAGGSLVGNWMAGRGAAQQQQQQPQQQPLPPQQVVSGGYQNQNSIPVATPVQGGMAQAQPTPVAQLTVKERHVAELTTRAQSRLPHLLEPCVEELNRQIDNKRKLQEGEAQVDAEIQSSRAELDEIKRRNAELIQAEAELQQFVAQHSENEPDINAMLEPSDDLGKQILDLTAEENALGDFLLALDEVLLSGKIPVDVFLREVREASRKQFLTRALREKVVRHRVAQGLSVDGLQAQRQQQSQPQQPQASPHPQPQVQPQQQPQQQQQPQPQLQQAQPQPQRQPLMAMPA